MLRHYLDDFFGGHPDVEVAAKQFEALKQWFIKLGIPTRDNKCHPPSRIIKILGTIYDTIRQKVYLPADKAQAYIEFINSVLDAKGSVHIDQLRKLNGRLRWAARHVWCGKNYCSALESLIWRDRNHTGSHFRRLNTRTKAQIRWWKKALRTFELGIPFDFILQPRTECGDRQIYTDACCNPTWAGIGGFSSLGSWFQFKFYLNEKYPTPDINYFEMLAIIVAFKLWAKDFSQQAVKLNIDSACCVGQLAKQHARDRSDLQALIDDLCHTSLSCQTHFYAEWLLSLIHI